MGFDTSRRPATARVTRSGSMRMSQRPTQSAAADSDDSPPRTPPSQIAKTRSSKTGFHGHQSRQKTFLDDMGQAETRRGGGRDSTEESDPHDLALSPKHATRTSVVDNMLLSLDQFAFSGPSPFDDYRLYNSALESSPYDLDAVDVPTRRGHQHGRTLSSSVSSDAGFRYDEHDGRTQPSFTRGDQWRDSSSKSTQQGPARNRNLRDGGGQPYGNGQGNGWSAGSTARNVRRDGQGSGLAQAGPDYASSNARMQSKGHRRSASFDHVARPPIVPLSDSTPDFDAESMHSADAAIAPSVPSGPRRLYPSSSHNDFGVESITHKSSRTPVASRRNSMKSTRAIQSRKGRGGSGGTGAAKSRDGDYSTVGDRGLDSPPPVPTNTDQTAPSPTVAFHKHTLPPVPASAPLPRPPEPTPPKERQGFFRRVFGSSKNVAAVPQDQPVREGSRSGAASGGNAPAPEVSSQVVNKKPSFFRRRKRSVAENVPPPPPLGPRLKDQESSAKDQPSPVSSLRQVMDPYTVKPGSPLFYDSKDYPDWSAIADGPAVEEPEKGHVARNDTAPTSARDPVPSSREAASDANDGQKKKYSLYPALAPPEHETLSVSGNQAIPTRPGTVDSHAIGDQSRLWLRSGSEDANQRSVRVRTGSESAADKTPTPKSHDSRQRKAEAATPAPSTDPQLTPKLTAAADIPKAQSSSTAGSRRLFLATKEQPEPTSDDDHYQTASSTPGIAAEYFDEGPDEPGSLDREQARRLYDSQDDVVGSEPAAAWLGDPDRASVRQEYMQLYDWSGMDILAALRSLCTRLVLKGETQQVDRVLDAFSTRWCECNPNHGFKATDVVHTICYSLLLLNTDLHLADIDQKMTKNQFVRNTLPTIHRVAMDAAPDAFDTSSKGRLAASVSDSSRLHAQDESRRPSTEPEASIGSSSIKRMERTETATRLAGESSGAWPPLVNAPFHGTIRAWEAQVETVLRDLYSSIQKERLPLHGAPLDHDALAAGSQASGGNLLGPNTNLLRRSPSIISKSGSDIFPRGRSADSRYGTSRWGSKPRSRARLYPPSNIGSSRTSLDDQSSLWSPSASSTWSKYSLSKLTSMSVDSLGSEYPRGDYQQSIGFANALSHAIIREDSANSIMSHEELDHTTPLLEDETLALAGAPWAKEGNLKHKHHLDAVDKKAKDRNWNESFAVIQQGWMRLFSFSSSTRSLRQKSKYRQPGGVVVGGGNWTENAEETWKFLLRQTIASALPLPGYSKSRPHVWALSLPTGAVHLFQAGTPEIVREFVSTANYWSARLSKEPLIGGVSNVEYGWSDAVINSAVIHAGDRSPPPTTATSTVTSGGAAARMSLQSSIRSSLDHQTTRPRLPADRVHINDWSPPQQSMVGSNLLEADQLIALQTYVKNVEDELQKHNELRPAMVLAFSPRHPNATKAMANWERKSSYLLREIVKFRTYIDSLQAAIGQKEKIYQARRRDSEEEVVVEDARVGERGGRRRSLSVD